MALTARRAIFGPFFSSGVLAGAAKIYHYEPGTSTLRDCYTDAAKQSTAAQPLVCDAAGVASAFFDGTYKLVVKTSDDTTLYTWDNWSSGTELGGTLTTLIFDEAATSGIKVDPDATDWPWHDLKGPIAIRGTGGTSPNFNVLTGGVREFQFDANDEVFLLLHIPHDYAKGTHVYVHFHWCQNATQSNGAASGTVTGGTVTWGCEVSYAKGHEQAAFAATVTTTVQQACTTTTLWHHIAEVQLSAASPTASQLDSDDLEPDGLCSMRLYLASNDITVASGQKPAPFLLECDLHYQSTNIGTKSKAPNFYA